MSNDRVSLTDHWPLAVIRALRHEQNHSDMQYARLRQACHVQRQTVSPYPGIVSSTRSSTQAVQGDWLLSLFLAQVRISGKHVSPSACGIEPRLACWADSACRCDTKQTGKLCRDVVKDATWPVSFSKCNFHLAAAIRHKNNEAARKKRKKMEGSIDVSSSSSATQTVAMFPVSPCASSTTGQPAASTSAAVSPAQPTTSPGPAHFGPSPIIQPHAASTARSTISPISQLFTSPTTTGFPQRPSPLPAYTRRTSSPTPSSYISPSHTLPVPIIKPADLYGSTRPEAGGEAGIRPDERLSALGSGDIGIEDREELADRERDLVATVDHIVNREKELVATIDQMVNKEKELVATIDQMVDKEKDLMATIDRMRRELAEKDGQMITIQREHLESTQRLNDGWRETTARLGKAEADLQAERAKLELQAVQQQLAMAQREIRPLPRAKKET
jgi:hypothetical protein